MEIHSRISIGQSLGTVLYIGSVSNFPGEWLGVDWDDETRGKHDGKYDGIRYFQARLAKSGSFVRLGKANAGCSLLSALRLRYADFCSETFPNHQIGSKSIEFVEMDKTVRKQKNFARLRVIVLNNLGISKPFDKSANELQLPCCTDLDLSHNLLYRWSDVFDISSSLLSLNCINLSMNIFKPLSPDQHFPVNQNVREIILSQCKLQWEQIKLLLRIFSKITHLVLCFNAISFISITCIEPFAFIRSLDLEGNAIGNFDLICKLSILPQLHYLNLNNTQLKSVHFDGDFVGFDCLEILYLCRNYISDWNSVDELDRLPSLTTLFMLKNKLINDNCSSADYRQMVIAKVCKIRQLDRIEVDAIEKRGAQLDYWRKFGAQFLMAEKSDTIDCFSSLHPNFARLVTLYGRPEDLQIGPKIDDGILKSRLCDIAINFSNGLTIFRSVPLTMTIHKLRTLVRRVCKMHQKTTFRLSIEDPKMAGHLMYLDNDLKDLLFYSVQSGDIIHIECDQ